MLYFSLLLYFCINTHAQPGQANFDWLVGAWAGENNSEEKQSFEVWEKLSTDSYRGIGYTVEAGDTVFIEKLSIDNIYGVPHYTADVSNNERPVQFEMIKISDTGFTCANPEHDFPKNIEYKLVGDRLTATISGEDREVKFVFMRQ